MATLTLNIAGSDPVENVEKLLDLFESRGFSFETTASVASPKSSPNVSKGAGPYELFYRRKFEGQKMPNRYGSTGAKEFGSRENFFKHFLTEEERTLAENAPAETAEEKRLEFKRGQVLEIAEMDEDDYN